ncbi:hypothetical protein THIOM_003908, partial [Candidatus Thiomargarita nelsonii]
IWLKNANCFGVETWDKARDLVKQLNSNKCGLRDNSKPGDWRLPTKYEWQVMMNARYRNPSLSNGDGTGKWTEGDVFSDVPSAKYWSSTESKSQTDKKSLRWSVFLSDGRFIDYAKTNKLHVWPVRGKIPAKAFTDNGNGTVTDNRTGLIWLKNA